MKGCKTILIILVLCMACIWADYAYPHGKEKHADKRTEAVAEPKDKGIEEKAIVPPPVLHEEHRDSKTVETGSFNLIQADKKKGYNLAVVFTISIAFVLGLVLFYWRDGRQG
jgi:hypothetical protein